MRRVSKDRKDHRVKPVLLDHKVRPEHRVQGVKLVSRVQWVLRDHKDRRARLANKDLLDQPLHTQILHQSNLRD